VKLYKQIRHPSDKHSNNDRTSLTMLRIELFNGEWARPFTKSFVAIVIPFVLYRIYLALRQPLVPKRAPTLIPEGIPAFGSLRFFTARWDFLREWLSQSSSISFLVGSNHVIAVSGDVNRAAFFESRELSFGDGYEYPHYS
jgi:hypothetical protein